MLMCCWWWILLCAVGVGFGPDARFSFPDRRHSFYSGEYPGVRVPSRLISCPSSLPVLRSVSRSAHILAGNCIFWIIGILAGTRKIRRANRREDETKYGICRLNSRVPSIANIIVSSVPLIPFHYTSLRRFIVIAVEIEEEALARMID